MRVDVRKLFSGMGPMTKRNGAIWLACLAAYLASIGPMQGADEGSEIRLDAEAKLLFKAVLTDEPTPEPCELEAKWDTYPIPEDVAREYLDSTAHAELASPQVAAQPAAILDLPSTSNAICGAGIAEVSARQRQQDFEASSEQTLLIRSTRYTFPVFSQDYRTAILVISHSVQEWARMAGGVTRLPVQAVGYAAVYARSENGWSRTTTIELFIT
jgi:hypothetical protein